MSIEIPAEGFCEGLRVTTLHGRAVIVNEHYTELMHAEIRGKSFRIVRMKDASPKEPGRKQIKFCPLYGYTLLVPPSENGVLRGPFALMLYNKDGEKVARVPLNVEFIDCAKPARVRTRDGQEFFRIKFDIFLNTSRPLY